MLGHSALRLRLFAVFAVFPGNLQPATSRLPRKSWAGDEPTPKITARTLAVFRCSLLFIEKKKHVHR
jgi:hypothetical protein